MQAVQLQTPEEVRIEAPEKKEYTVGEVELRITPGYRFAKRFFDLSVSLVMLIVLAVPMLLIGTAVWCTSPGRALYRQERLGKDGKKFLMLKFRSMAKDAEKDGPQWARENDQRCTWLGVLLRKTRLDELPQLWNILMGDMSFVGPRPEREHFYNEFETYINGFSKRLMAKPGLTGWAQVNGGYDLLPEEKIVYDVEYIENISLKMDLKCVLKTVRLVFTHEGAR